MLFTHKIDRQRFDRSLALIASGSMSHVFRTFDTKIEAIVALKMPAATSEARIALAKEARALNRIKHPNVIRLIESGILKGYMHGIRCAIMEYLEGDTLKTILETRRTMPWDSVEHPAKPVILKLCSALAAVHEAGFVHRDIKPSNVFLTRAGPKLFDFGVSTHLKLRFREVVFEAGNGYYAAPETSNERSIRKADHRSDIYSLGILLYRMVSGLRPARPEFPRETGPIYLSLLKPSGLAAVVTRATAEEPGKRFQTMVEMAEALGSL